MNLTIRKIMDDLVSAQSDSGTAMETDAAKKIISYFEKDHYFSTHPENFGLEKTGDFLGRPVVWALKKGIGPNTIILTGHYDAVEINSYGQLKQYALSPDLLKKEIIKRGMGNSTIKKDLNDDDWVFGRGTADMKGGLALGIYKTLEASEKTEGSILFVAVPDEENLSAGTRNAIKILTKIRDKFQLNYKATFILEPQLSLQNDNFLMYNGSIGKMMPLLLVKGKLAHCGEPLKGINSAHLISEITSCISSSVDFITEDMGLTTQVPMVQMVRDLKESYDVSIPEYSAAFFNLLFVGDESGPKLLELFRKKVSEGTDTFMRKYGTACKMTKEKGLICHTDVVDNKPKILDIDDLEKLAKEGTTDFDGTKNQIITRIASLLNSGKITMAEASIQYVKEVLSLLDSDDPVIIMGICPPYYPPVNNSFLGDGYKEILDTARKSVKEETNLDMDFVPYFTGIGDGSYFLCRNAAKERKITDKIILPKEIYDLPLEEAQELGAPCFYLGPRSRDIHQWSERVYMPDLEKIVPHIIDEILDKIFNEK